MSSLADLREIVGFFSYSREDDSDSLGALSALRSRIQGELRGQLGRTAKTFRLWQDKEAIPFGAVWEAEIKTAAAQSVFFIPIITPTVVASQYCRFELEAFLAREAELGRSDLIFPILYIDVPALEDSARRQNDPVLSLIAKRQYVDWRKLRHRDVHTTEVSEAVEQFCRNVRDALNKPWLSPAERAAQEKAAAAQRAEDDRKRQEAEARRQEEEERKRAAAARERARAEEERRQREEEAEQRRTEERRLREEARAKRLAAQEQRRAEKEERRRQRAAQARPLWPPSRPVLVAASAVGLILIGAIGVWLAERRVPTSPAGPAPARPRVASTPAPAAPTPPASVAPAPPPAAPRQLAGDAPLPPAQERALKPGDTFQECAKCPVMMVVPAGTFTMGAPATDPRSNDNEGPQHQVRIASQFAVGLFALTFAEWDACVADGGCHGHRPADQGFGRALRPVINVSWIDAKAYVAWLSRKTGKAYRLLSEAEYEYSARAGSTTAYPWGDDIGMYNANCNGCGSRWDNEQTAPVGMSAPNQFGLYDMVGNVWEWTEDCWHDSYNGAPANDSAWTSGPCSRRVERGGSWNSTSRDLRSASRHGDAADVRSRSIGFRVGRTLLAR